MDRYLKEGHETQHLYFTSERKSKECIVCGDSDTIVWWYDTDHPKSHTLESVFYLITDGNTIRNVEDLRVIYDELHFDLDLFSDFNHLLNKKISLDKELERYRELKLEVKNRARKL